MIYTEVSKEFFLTWEKDFVAGTIFILPHLDSDFAVKQ